MKFTFLVAAIIAPFFSFAQEIPKLKLTPSGVEAIVVSGDSLKADYLYMKSINWVQ